MYTPAIVATSFAFAVLSLTHVASAQHSTASASSARPSGGTSTASSAPTRAGTTASPAPTTAPRRGATAATTTAASPAPGSAGTASSAPPPTGPGATVTRAGDNTRVDFAGENVQGNTTTSQGASTQVRNPGQRPGLIRTRENFRTETLRGVENQSTP